MGITRSKRSWSGIMRISDACVRAQSARLCLLLTPKEGQAGAFSLKRADRSPGVCAQCSVFSIRWSMSFVLQPSKEMALSYTPKQEGPSSLLQRKTLSDVQTYARRPRIMPCAVSDRCAAMAAASVDLEVAGVFGSDGPTLGQSTLLTTLHFRPGAPSTSEQLHRSQALARLALA